MAPLDLDLQRIKADIQNSPSLHTWVTEVLLFDQIDSTNRVGMQMGSEGYPGGILILAEEQTMGRGRLNRVWHSPKGVNLYLSLLIRPHLPQRDFPLFSLATAVALVNAIQSDTGFSCVVKWPNDILFEDKKIAGILLDSGGPSGRSESVTVAHHKMSHSSRGYLVVGIGINVNWEKEEIPDDINATSLKIISGHPVDRNDLIRAILEALAAQFSLLEHGGKGLCIQALSDVCATLTKPVVVHTPHESTQGIAEKILENGELLLRLPDGTKRKILLGDVTHLRS